MASLRATGDSCRLTERLMKEFCLSYERASEDTLAFLDALKENKMLEEL